MDIKNGNFTHKSNAIYYFSPFIYVKMRLALLFNLFLIITTTFGQESKNVMQKHEDSLVNWINEVRKESSLQVMLEKNNYFEQKLRQVLRNDLAFNYPFDSLSKLMGTIKSPDNQFRLFNWNLEIPKTEEQYFFCLVMNRNPIKNEFEIIELFDKSKFARNPENNQYTEKNWYGALYYDIIPMEKMGKIVYTLLGWDGNDITSNKKIIESMTFAGSGIKFGLPIFKMDDDKTQRRVIFEYSQLATMSLRHQVVKKRHFIIFDHLSPTSPQLEGMKSWYVPDMSYDAFVWDGKKWVYQSDVDARNPKTNRDFQYNTPPEPDFNTNE